MNCSLVDAVAPAEFLHSWAETIGGVPAAPLYGSTQPSNHANIHEETHMHRAFNNVAARLARRNDWR
jgi:hypothetical protein